MSEFFQKLFNTSDFPARWTCGQWSDFHGWLHIVSDVGIALAYLAIPLILGFYLYRKPDLRFRPIWFLFCGFIFFCGSTHLVEAAIFYYPIYRISGLLKFVTAVISWVCVFVLLKNGTHAFSLKTHAALEEENYLFKRLADSISQFAWMADTNGYIYWYNKRWYEYTGTTLEEVQGWGWQVVQHPDHVERVVESFKQHLEEGTVWEDTFPLRGKDGEYRWFLTRAMPIKNKDDQIDFWVGTNTDITEQRNLQKELSEIAHQLTESDVRKDVFIATLAHELRNPLSPLCSGIDILRMSDDRAIHQKVCNTMEPQIKHLVVLVDDLLDVSRIKSGKLTLKVEWIDLAPILRNSLESVRISCEESGHALLADIPTQPLMVYGDPNRLTQVFTNLLSNACKYTPSGGTIRMEVHYNGDVTVKVIDTGIGIDEANHKSIFDLFGQVEHPLEKSYSGLGIGLTLAESIVTLHGGTLTVESQPGRGSTFTVCIPRQDGKDPKEMAEMKEQVETAQEQIKVLIVDDNQAAADMLQMLIDMMGHEARIANDGTEAIAVLESYRPQLIFMDLGMPRMNGYDATTHIRKQEWGEDIYIAALTGWGHDDDKLRTKDSGFNAHIVKPASNADIHNIFLQVRKPKSGNGHCEAEDC